MYIVYIFIYMYIICIVFIVYRRESLKNAFFSSFVSKHAKTQKIEIWT